MGKNIYLFILLTIFSNVLFTGCENLKKTDEENVEIKKPVEIVEVEEIEKLSQKEELDKTKDKRKLTISLVGDILMDGSVKRQINAHGYDYPWEYVKEHFQEDDISIGNLETSITTGGTKWPDKQFNFRSDSENLEAMRKAGVDLVSLANNHSLDYGYDGLLDTLDYIDKSGIGRVGAGKNHEEAIKELIIEKNGYKIGVLGFSRVVPSVDWYATNNRPGLVGAYDSQLEGVLEKVEKVKKEVDVLVLSIHWGTELQTYPRDIDVVAGKKLIDAGADIIMGHHPHVLQGIQIYKGKPIFYSLGNFVFGTKNELTSNTMIGQINFVGNKIESLKVIPYNIVSGRPTPVSQEETNKKIQYINELSKEWNVKFNSNGIVQVN